MNWFMFCVISWPTIGFLSGIAILYLFYWVGNDLVVSDFIAVLACLIVGYAAVIILIAIACSITPVSGKILIKGRKKETNEKF